MLKEIKGRLNTVLFVGREGGFTIVELMVASALSLIVMTGIYTVYHSQQKSYIVREQITVMQQNLRAGMVIMTDDIRMAGYWHPTQLPVPAGVIVGINDANPTSVAFTLLKDKTNNPASKDHEKITFSLNANNELQRTTVVTNISSGTTVTTGQVLAENVDALDFVYLKGDGTVTTVPAEVKSVQVTMVVRTGKGDPDYSDLAAHGVYINQQGTTIFTPTAANDNYRRRTLSREIKCRNL